MTGTFYTKWSWLHCVQQRLASLCFRTHTWSRSGNFRTSCSWRSILVLDYTSPTHVLWHMLRNLRRYLVEQNQCNAKQAVGATGVFIVTSAQLSRNRTMKHEAMPDHASFDVKLQKVYIPKVYTQMMGFLFSATSYDLVFLWIAYIIWLVLQIARLYYWVKVY